jgi:hypothetical protein
MALRRNAVTMGLWDLFLDVECTAEGSPFAP